MNYKIVFTKNEPPEPRVVVKKDTMIVFSKGDENSETDFQTLKNILEGASYKDWDKVLKFIEASHDSQKCHKSRGSNGSKRNYRKRAKV